MFTEKPHRDVDVPVEFSNIPAARRQELDLCIRSSLERGLRPDQIDQQLKLRQRYGVPQSAIRVYAKRLKAAGVIRVAGCARQADASDTPPSTVRRLDTLILQSLDCIHRKFQDPELTPEQLARLVTALSQQRRALIRAQAQNIATRLDKEQRAKRRREQAAELARQRRDADAREELRDLFGPMGKEIPDIVLDTAVNLKTLKMIGALTPHSEPPLSKRARAKRERERTAATAQRCRDMRDAIDRYVELTEGPDDELDSLDGDDDDDQDADGQPSQADGQSSPVDDQSSPDTDGQPPSPDTEQTCLNNPDDQPSLNKEKHEST